MNSTTINEPAQNNDDLASRKAALNMLGQIIDRKNALDITLDLSGEYAALDPRDRAFTRMLLSTTLRRLGQIDDLITFAQDRPDALKTPILKNILRLGITQMFFMGVPDHASVDTSVRLAEFMRLDKQKSFVNGILRSLGRDGKTRLEKQDAPRLNTPDWLLKIWIHDYGMTTAAQIAAANMSEAALDITVKNKSDSPYFGNALQATQLSTGSLRRITRGNVKELDGFHDGKWWVQDAAAAIPATLFGDISGKHIIDMCAAPGGKTLQLASMDASVTAIDRSAKRLKRVRENLNRMNLQENVTIETADAAVWTPKQPPTHILLDAPCSATGTIRRHPDNVYLKSPEDIARLCTIQERLLNRAADILAANGTIIYCTCSLQKDEGEHQIEKFLNNHPNFKRAPISADEVGKYNEIINENGDIRILPSMLKEQGGIDGFFISRLIKAA